MLRALSSASLTVRPIGYVWLSLRAVTCNPSSVVVWEINSITVSRDVSGLARQLMEMKEKRRGSIFVHLLVAGGKCATVNLSCSSVARGCKAFFPILLRPPLSPPPPDVKRDACHVGCSP